MNFTQEYLVGRPNLVRRVFELGGAVFNGKQQGAEHHVRCVFHQPDEKPSLDINLGKVAYICRACGAGGDAVEFIAKVRRVSVEDAIAIIRRELQLDGDKAAKPDERSRYRYEIRDAMGTLVRFHERIDYSKAPKKFFWIHPDGRYSKEGETKSGEMPLYGSERLATATAGSAVIVVEGEKTADALTANGFLAVGTVTGAGGTPRAKSLAVLRGFDVVTWPDYLDGEVHMERIAAALDGVAASVRTLTWGEQKGDDAADFFARGGTEEQLDRLLAEASAPTGTAASTTRRLTVSWDEFMAETFPPVPSLWGDAFLVKGGGYALLAGDTGVGKTILKANLIFSLAEGRDEFLGFALPGRQVPILLLEAEGSRHRFRDRLRQIAEARCIHGPLPIYFHERNTELAIEGPNLQTMIAESGAEYVLLDAIGRFWTGNENDATEWRAGVTTPLAKLTTCLNIAVSFNDHPSKPNENRSGQHKVRGSAAKTQDCGAAMRLEYGRAGGRSRILYFDRVRDGGLPFPDLDPCRMALEIDVAAGTIKKDERAGDLESDHEARTANVVVTAMNEIQRDCPGDVSTTMLHLKVQTLTGLGKSSAKNLVASAVAAGKIEHASRGWYRLPGTLGAEP